jgi:Rap1a immunity proteins
MRGRVAVAMVVVAALLLVLAANASPALAQGKTGFDLLRECEGRVTEVRAVGEILCAAYVQGVVDAYGFVSGWLRPEHHHICLPAGGIENEQATRVITRWLQSHAADLYLPARLHVIVALRQAFPC